MYFFKWEITDNTDPHNSQENIFCPVFVCMSLPILTLWNDRTIQYISVRFLSHIYLCFSILNPMKNDLLTWKKNDVSPVSIRLFSFFKWISSENAHVFFSQKYGFSVMCFCMCLLKFDTCENNDLQQFTRATPQLVFGCVF